MPASLSPRQIRTLSVLAGAGAESASAAIARLTGRPIAARRPQVEFIEIRAASDLVQAIRLATRPGSTDDSKGVEPPGDDGGGPADNGSQRIDDDGGASTGDDGGGLTGIAFDLSGSIEGSILVVFTPTQAADLLSRLARDEGLMAAANSGAPSRMSESTLAETANIVAGAFISSIAALIGGAVANSVPRLLAGVLPETLDGFLPAPNLPRKGCAVFEAGLRVHASPPAGLIIFLPEAGSMGSRLQSLQTL